MIYKKQAWYIKTLIICFVLVSIFEVIKYFFHIDIPVYSKFSVYVMGWVFLKRWLWSEDLQ